MASNRISAILSHINTDSPISFSLSSSPSSSSSPPPSEEILFRIHSNGCGEIELNRHSALNALNLHMIRLLYHKLIEWKSCSSVRFLLLRSSLKKAFCAGGDIRSLAYPPSSSPRYPYDFFYNEYRCNYILGTYPKPIISLLNGIVMGGGAGLSMHGDMRIIDPSTIFAMPETGIGLFPDVGASWIFTHLKPRWNYLIDTSSADASSSSSLCERSKFDDAFSIGLYLGLLGSRIQSDDLFISGLGSHYIEKGVETLYSHFTTTSFSLSHSSKTSFLHEISSSLSPFISIPNFNQSILRKQFSIIQSIFKKNHSLSSIIDQLSKEGTDTTLYNTLPKNVHPASMNRMEFCRYLSNTLATKSPTSLLVTHEAIHYCLSLHSLRDALTIDYRIAARMVSGRLNNDFQEGVRALLIDKHQKPKWSNPAHQQKIKQLFQPFQPNENFTELNFSDQ